MKFRRFLLLPALILSTILASVSHGNACSRMYPFRLNELFVADFIVRATAVKYIVSPVPNTRTTGVPESTIEFKVEETIWGGDVPSTIVLHGYLTDTDDFNEVPPPYQFVRPGGRAGSCFANSYKQGAQFLLFVKRGAHKASTSGYTTNINALGPTNEQIRGAEDPWVKWVKAYLSPCPAQDGKDSDFGRMSQPEMESVAGKQVTNLDKYRFAKCYVTRFGLNDDAAKNHARVIDYYETKSARDRLPAPR
jgi:hypothetical protein